MVLLKSYLVSSDKVSGWMDVVRPFANDSINFFLFSQLA